MVYSPFMTCPTPSLNSKGLPRSREESNFFPLVSVPVSSVCEEREEVGMEKSKKQELRTRKLEASGV